MDINNIIFKETESHHTQAVKGRWIYTGQPMKMVQQGQPFIFLVIWSY